MRHKFFDLTFTPSVKAAQQQYGSRRHYAKYESGESDFAGLGEGEREFISQRDGFYLATVGENLQPYIQFRGGKRGFLKVLDGETLAFADFRGNLQYISVGNLKHNDKAALFLMDYANRQRLKILARVEVKDAKEAPELTVKVTMPGDKSVIERVMILHVEAYDWNCPQHITQRFTAEEIEEGLSPLYERIEKLEAENRRLRQQLESQELTAIR
jgi:predicted pyridoxine 5'-phosphate oxidase superfamily flavin-nucleotide-binding protein